MLWRRDYAELIVSRFSHQIQYEYYGGNMLVSIEGKKLEHFSDTYQEKSLYHSHNRTCHAMFHSFMPDNSKQYAATKDAHIKWVIELLKNRKGLGAGNNTILENIYGCAEHYRCATASYLLSILSKSFNIIIGRVISAPWHGR